MNRTQFRAAQRARINAAQTAIARELGLPKAFFQFAKRHGVMPETVRNERLKFPS